MEYETKMIEEDVRITKAFWEKVLTSNEMEFHEHMTRYLKLHPGKAFYNYMEFQSTKVGLHELLQRAQSFLEQTANSN